jgi:hypothetical protein
MSRVDRSKAFAAGLALAALGGCATGAASSEAASAPPAWFGPAAEAAAAKGYPELTDVPAAPSATNAESPAWQTLEQELVAARDALRTDERATPAPANAPAEAAAFREGAVRAIETTRSRY